MHHAYKFGTAIKNSPAPLENGKSPCKSWAFFRLYVLTIKLTINQRDGWLGRWDKFLTA